ncbi:MAG: hypothetical protein LBB79_04475 [Prevotellaceae bacterium]|nr:hypothetical protein [Prevotellaceae bacterium]
MIGKLPKDDHREFFRTRLADLINPQHELALLAHAMGMKRYRLHGKATPTFLCTPCLAARIFADKPPVCSGFDWKFLLDLI